MEIDFYFIAFLFRIKRCTGNRGVVANFSSRWRRRGQKEAVVLPLGWLHSNVYSNVITPIKDQVGIPAMPDCLPLSLHHCSYEKKVEIKLSPAAQRITSGPLLTGKKYVGSYVRSSWNWWTDTLAGPAITLVGGGIAQPQVNIGSPIPDQFFSFFTFRLCTLPTIN